MALPSNGIITLEDIQEEFGGPDDPISLLNYYRGGDYVPDTPANAGIPTSGVIGLQDFYGAAKITEVEISVGIGEKIDELSTTTRGFIVSDIGTRTPTSFRGQTIQRISCSDPGGFSAPSFSVILNGNLDKGFFVEIEIERTDGDTLVLKTEDASHVPGSDTSWVWTAPGSFPLFDWSMPWTSTTPSPRKVTFRY